MKTMLSILIVVLAGIAGLAFVFTDVLIAPPGIGRIALAGLFYVVVGFALAKLQARGRPIGWALASSWGLALLGVIGLWISVTESASGDITLALLFVLGPLASTFLGGWAGSRGAGRGD